MRRSPGVTVVIVLLTTSGIGCLPYAGRGRVSPPVHEVLFADANDGTPVEPVLVLPVYTSWVGYSMGAGDGPSGMTGSKTYLTRCFAYRPGDAYRLRGDRASGIVFLLPFTFAGKASHLEGFLAVAPGHRITLVSDGALYMESGSVRLRPESLEQSRKDMSELAVLLRAERIDAQDLAKRANVDDRDGILEHSEKPEDRDWEIRFNDAERKTIRGFLSEVPEDSNK